MPDRRGRRFQSPPVLLQNLSLGPFHPVLQFIQPLLPPVDHVHHAPERAVLCHFGQRLPPISNR